jgi:hypothetical protein
VAQFKGAQFDIQLFVKSLVRFHRTHGAKAGIRTALCPTLLKDQNEKQE